MKLLLLIILFFTAGPGELEKGKNWFRKRAEGAKEICAKPEPINKAIAHFELALKEGNNREEAAYYLLRSYRFKGSYSNAERRDKRDFFNEKRNLAKSFVEEFPKSAPIRLEYVALMGLWADQVGAITAGMDGVLGKIRRNTEVLMQLDPNLADGAALRTLGILNIRVPKIPMLLSWPDKQTGLKLLKKAYTKFPKHPGNMFYYAEALHVTGNNDNAKAVLMKLIKIPLRDEFTIQDKDYKIQAQKRLKEW